MYRSALRSVPLSCALLCALSSTAAAVEWQAVTAKPAGEPGAWAIPWQNQAPEHAQLTLAEHAHPVQLSAWSHTDGLHLQMVIQDDSYSPMDDLKWLWRGDCVYVEIDGLGDNSNQFGFGSDDLDLFFALSARGAVGRILNHGSAHLIGDLDAQSYTITYNSETQRFTYTCLVPWSLMGTAPGMTRQLGLAVVSAHKDSEKRDNTWGERSNQRKQTRGLINVDLASPNQPFAVIANLSQQPLLPPAALVRVPVSRFATDTGTLLVRSGTSTTDLTLPAGLQVGYAVFSAAELEQSAQWSLRCDGLERQVHIETLSSRHRQIMERLARTDTQGNPIAELHVRSLLALAEDCLNRSRLFAHSASNNDIASWSARVFDWQRRVLETLPEGGFDLPTHLKTGRPLLMAFVSDGDGSLQFATVQIPEDYDPRQQYPLVAYLHGAGPRVPVDYLLTQVDNSHQDTLWRSGSDPATLNSAQRHCILVSPFGRGTVFYRDLGEMDCWQAWRLAEQQFSIDPDRRYLAGFSMGGAGAVRLASRRPDHWAAVLVAAGFLPGEPHAALLSNLSEVPLYVWCGEKDTRMINWLHQYFLPQAASIGKELALLTISPQTVHTFPYNDFAGELARCFEHTRNDYESFRYRPLPRDLLSDGKPGRNGILGQGAWYGDFSQSSFSVHHHNNHLTILSDPGYEQFLIQPEDFGHFAPSLNRQSELVITWNGREAYRGPVQAEITLKPAPSPDKAK